MARCGVEVSRRYMLELWEDEYEDLLRFVKSHSAELVANPRLARVYGALLRANESEQS